MKTDKITIFGLFEKQKRYLVPIFQRGYVWTQENQWQPLWENILEQVTTLRDQTTLSSSIRNHFLGAIVLNQIPVMARQVACSEIIDGQQRFITLQVFLAAFRDAVAALNNQHLNSQLALLTYNSALEVKPEEHFKVWPTNAYQDDFKDLMQSKSAEDLAAKYPQHWYYRKLRPPRPPIVDAYFFFHKCISNYLSELDDDQEQSAAGACQSNDSMNDRAMLLYDAITRHVQMVEIELSRKSSRS